MISNGTPVHAAAHDQCKGSSSFAGSRDSGSKRQYETVRAASATPDEIRTESDLQQLQKLPSSTISSLFGVQFIVSLGHLALTLADSHLNPCDSIAGATL